MSNSLEGFFAPLPGYGTFAASSRSYEPFNAIIGRMVLDLLGFEGRIADHQTKMEMQAVVETARTEAISIGVDPSRVDEVAVRINVYVR